MKDTKTIIILSNYQFKIPEGMSTIKTDERFDKWLELFLRKLQEAEKPYADDDKENAKKLVALLRAAYLLCKRAESHEGMCRISSIYLQYCEKICDLIADYDSRQVSTAPEDEIEKVNEMMLYILVPEYFYPQGEALAEIFISCGIDKKTAWLLSELNDGQRRDKLLLKMLKAIKARFRIIRDAKSYVNTSMPKDIAFLGKLIDEFEPGKDIDAIKQESRSIESNIKQYSNGLKLLD